MHYDRIMTIETGDEYPLADIVGTDLSPTQSTWCVVISQVAQTDHLTALGYLPMSSSRWMTAKNRGPFRNHLTSFTFDTW